MQQVNTDSKKKNMQNSQEEFYADTMEAETKQKAAVSINCEKGIFAHAFADGLNRDKGIFDQAALFRTK